MFDALQRPFQSLVAPAIVERATLLANHVIAAEPAALARLQPHRGRSLRVQLDGVPGWLPAPPQLVFAITPAGLLEWQGDASSRASATSTAEAALVLRVDASQPGRLPSQLLAGQRPPVQIEGDAALAADVGWLIENLRWDLAADLERLLPPAVVQQLVGIGQTLRSGLASLLSAWRAPR